MICWLIKINCFFRLFTSPEHGQDVELQAGVSVIVVVVTGTVASVPTLMCCGGPGGGGRVDWTDCGTAVGRGDTGAVG